MLRTSLRSAHSNILRLSASSRSYASVTNVRLVQSKEALAQQVMEKYRSKLELKAQQEGLSSADDLKEQLKDKISEIKLQMNKIDPLKELEDYEKAMKFTEAQKQKAAKKTLDPIDPKAKQAPFKTLDSFIQLDKFAELGQQEIEYIWRARFASDAQALVAAIPSETYQTMYQLARKNPSFVLPLPKEDAQLDIDEGDISGDQGTPMEVHYVQWTFVGPHTTHCMITSLMEYKLHGEYARPHTTIAFHQELEQSKGLVLMKGQVESEAPITPPESQLLLLNLQRFYGALGTESDIAQQRIQLLKDFNSGSGDFSMEKCIELSQSMEN